jgi:hypothetical protein
MAHLIDKDALVEEMEKEIKCIYAGREYVGIPSDKENIIIGIQKVEDIIDTLEVKVDFENYNKVKRTLSLSFMNFLDNNRPEGKMCLSNGECFDIDKAFDEMDFAKLFRYMKKYLKL